jgi:hypothetical protein
MEEVFQTTIANKQLSNRQKKCLARIKAKKRHQVEHPTRARRRANYVPLSERDPELHTQRCLERRAKAEERVVRREAEGKTPYPRHYTRQYEADKIRLEAARLERNDHIRKELESGGEMEVKP